MILSRINTKVIREITAKFDFPPAKDSMDVTIKLLMREKKIRTPNSFAVIFNVVRWSINPK